MSSLYFSRLRSTSSEKYGPDAKTESYPISCANRTVGTTWYLGAKWVGNSKVILDNVTHDYWRRRARGDILPMHPLQITETKSSISGSTSFRVTTVATTCTGPAINSYYQNSGSFLVQNVWPNGPPAMAESLTAREKENLLSELHLKAMAERGKGKANLLESLAELDKSWAMIIAPLENVQKLIRNLRRNGQRLPRYRGVRADRVGDIFDVIGFTSAEWLRLRYGLMPIISDVKAVIKALEETYSLEAKRHTAKASGNLTASASVPNAFTAGGGAYRVNWTDVMHENYDARVVFVDEYVRGLWDDLGFNIQNLIGLSWELTRLSHVVDWFFNIGDLIYANAPRVSMKPITAYYSVKEVVKRDLIPTGLTGLLPLSYTVTGSVNDTGTVIRTVKTRCHPGLASGFSVKTDFKLTQWLRASDAAAITNQLLRSIRFA